MTRKPHPRAPAPSDAHPPSPPASFHGAPHEYRPPRGSPASGSWPPLAPGNELARTSLSRRDKRDLVDRLWREGGDLLVEATLERLRSGSDAIIIDTWARLFGRPRQSVEVTAEPGSTYLALLADLLREGDGPVIEGDGRILGEAPAREGDAPTSG